MERIQYTALVWILSLDDIFPMTSDEVNLMCPSNDEDSDNS